MTDPEEQHIWNLTEHGRWSEAEAAARARLVRHPGSAWTFQALAYALHAQSRLDEAAEAADQACRLAPANPWNFVIRSRIAVSQRAGDEAVESARRAVELAPSMWKAHHQLANAHLTHLDAYGTRHFQPANALAPAREATRLAPTSVEAHHSLAHAFRALGRRRESRDAYLFVLSLDPHSASALAGLADYYGKSRPGTAARYLTASLEQRPGFDGARRSLTWVIHTWIRRMTSIWLVGGAAIVLGRWFVAPPLAMLAVVVLAALCLIGTSSILRNLPPRALPDLWRQSRYPSGSRVAVLLATAVVVSAAAVCPVQFTVPAALALGLLGLAEWKTNFFALERRYRQWRAHRRGEQVTRT
jgi:tetratricopeptide (TPR) repeat protein